MLSSIQVDRNEGKNQNTHYKGGGEKISRIERQFPLKIKLLSSVLKELAWSKVMNFRNYTY